MWKKFGNSRRLSTYTEVFSCAYHIGDNPVMAISLLPYLIPDARSKPEIEKILQLSHVSVSSQFKAALHVWM